MKQFVGAVAILAAAIFFAAPASAVTLVKDGKSFNISEGDQFVGTVVAEGGDGIWAVGFESAVELLVDANAALTNVIAGTFTDLKMSWFSASAEALLSQTSVLAGITNLATFFTLPNDLNQILVLSWSDSQEGAGFGIDVSASSYVAAVPLPAGLLLMLTALAGLGAVGLRRKTAAAT